MLRHRYLIQQILGQGGFGRTYLALDQERFNEPCVIKEFAVLYQDDTLIQKSKTLFQREASILYQIQHPQIPRFWAAFEDGQRLFLVQDYVHGQTYRRLLGDRKQQGQAFSQAEVVHFLNHLLPVLTYIHDRDIVHRDITPENIILREQATTELVSSESTVGLPVLIDFGAVKEATSHWPLMSAATRVGKVGYAPPEQLQTGKVYPNSDLYALAATSLALLTGKEPQNLLDSQTLSWRWQSYATIDPQLGRILQKMLAIYPGDRYASAREVLAELQPLLELSSESTILPAAGSLHSSPQLESVPASNSLPDTEEGAVITYTSPGRRSRHGATPQKANRAATPFQRGLQWGIGATVIAGLGIATPILWRAYNSQPESGGDVWVSGTRVPQSEAARILESQTNAALKFPNSSESSSSAGVTSQPVQPVQFPPGKLSTVVTGSLPANTMQPYSLEGAEGQIMTVTLEGSGVVMNLLRSNQEAVDTSGYQTHNWTGQLPASDRYLIQVMGSGPYTLDVAMSPLSRPVQEQTQRITFSRGTSGTTVTGTVSPQQVRRYLLKAKKGQTLALNQLQGKANLSLIAPNGERIGGSAHNSKIWKGRLPVDGDYVIEVATQQSGEYVLSLAVY
jgi:serine/threonine-protein kinase